MVYYCTPCLVYYAYFVFNKNRSYIHFHQLKFLRDGVGNGHDLLAFYHCRILDNVPFVEYYMCAKFVIGEDRTPDTCKFTIVSFRVCENVNWNLGDTIFRGDLYATINGVFHRDVIELIY